ncbi:hypothetical protein BDV12DRAFT_178958 [Aspergillus spectabilis]
MSSLNGYILPIELLQAILRLLDIESFYLAALTCELWRMLAFDAHNLRYQLRAVPSSVLPPSLLKNTTTAHQLRALFQDVRRKNLIGLRSAVELHQLDSKAHQPSRIGDIPIRSHRQRVQFARMRGMTLTLHGSSELSKGREIQLSPTIYPSRDPVPQMWSHYYSQRLFSSRASARFQVALSQCGELVAVGLGPKIQVYLLQPGKVAQVRYAEAKVSDSLLDSIQSLEFSENGEFLRCEVNGIEGAYVKYLGGRKPPFADVEVNVYGMRSYRSGFDKMRQWKNGLSRVHLDSRNIEEGLRGGLGLSVSLRGMRLLTTPSREYEADEHPGEGYFFGLLREGSCDNRYVVGSISSDNAVRIIQQIPTRRTSATYLTDLFELPKASLLESSANMVNRWDPENLPSAHCHGTLLAVSDDGKILAICELPYGQVQGGIYICSAHAIHSDVDAPQRVAAWPFVLSTLEHDLDSIQIKLDRDTGVFIVRGQSQQHMMQWTLQQA